jgi:4-amino-4-deoxy-L-arabinose transferase-like glycosyltransferase
MEIPDEVVEPLDKIEQRLIIFFIFVCIFVYFFGAFKIPLMEIDAAQYANISRRMLTNHHYLELIDRGQDYLDKPPMLFWLSALSMRVWGVKDVAFRLPSVLFALLAIYSTYRFALLFYRKEIALLSALVLASCQALFLITQDVKTDTMLMGWVMLSIWQLARWCLEGQWGSFFIAAFAIAGGMMTKGPIALLVPIFALSSHFLCQRSFKRLFRWEYALLLLIILIVLAPMDIGLYRQFDLHPEKIVNGHTGVSGLRFYYWTQSFGRITGESPWHENGYFFFLAWNMLWSFLPWVVFFGIGLASEVFQLIKNKFRIPGHEEWISTGGFIITYCALAFSHYQLPGYIFVVFPLAAVITGKFLFKLWYTDEFLRWRKPLYRVHSILFLVLFLVVIGLLHWSFPSMGRWPARVAILCLAILAGLLLKRVTPLPQLLLASLFTIIAINVFLDVAIYPNLLTYQTGVAVSRVMDRQHLPKDRFFLFQMGGDSSLEFYTDSSFSTLKTLAGTRQGDYVLAPEQECASLNTDEFKVVYRGESFHVSRLSFKFWNPATRSKVVLPYCILQRI